jgi:hypothetical protein
MASNRLAWVASVIALLFVAAASLRIYAIDEAMGGLALWSSDEAYFIAQVHQSGYYASVLKYPWILFKTFIIGGFAAVELPQDQRAHLTILRVGSSGVEHHTLKLAAGENGEAGGYPTSFTPLEGRIYAKCPWLMGQSMKGGRLVGNELSEALCWWAGDHFEKATLEESRRLDGVNKLTVTDFENNEEGWSRRGFVAGPNEVKLLIVVGDKFRVSVANMARKSAGETLSINVLRQGGPPETIGEFVQRNEMVGRSEYRGTFQ